MGINYFFNSEQLVHAPRSNVTQRWLYISLSHFCHWVDSKSHSLGSWHWFVLDLVPRARQWNVSFSKEHFVKIYFSCVAQRTQLKGCAIPSQMLMIHPKIPSVEYLCNSWCYSKWQSLIENDPKMSLMSKHLIILKILQVTFELTLYKPFKKYKLL